MLEAFSDSFGGWRVVDVMGKSLMDLDDGLVADLIQWRHLMGIMQKGIEKRNAK